MTVKNIFPSQVIAPHKITLSGKAKNCRSADIFPVQKVKLPFIWSKRVINDTKPDGKWRILNGSGACPPATCYLFFQINTGIAYFDIAEHSPPQGNFDAKNAAYAAILERGLDSDDIHRPLRGDTHIPHPCIRIDP